jgi:orotate phosphoribosyltransferase
MTVERRAAGLLGPEGIAQLVRRGHFAYESGDHGDVWLALELLFRDPRRLQPLAALLAQRLRAQQADLVCAPLVGGALVGLGVAHELGLAYAYAERHPPSPGHSARYALPPALRAGLAGKRVIVVDDAINAGSAAAACVREVAACGGRAVALAALVVRESAPAELARSLALPVEALLAVPWQIWPADGCPRCRSGQPLDAPSAEDGPL